MPPKPRPTGGFPLALKFLPKRFHYFGYNYSNEYKTFILQYVNQDDYHPLSELRKRVTAQRPRTGLWWHVTVDRGTSVKRVVRTWVRRRLTNAFLETLKERGLSDQGKLLPAEGGDYNWPAILKELAKTGEDLTLKGSIKLHAEKAVVSAKFVELKKETDIVVDSLLQGLAAEMQQKRQISHPQQRPHKMAARELPRHTARPSKAKYEPAVVPNRPRPRFSILAGKNQQAPASDKVTKEARRTTKHHSQSSISVSLRAKVTGKLQRKT